MTSKPCTSSTHPNHNQQVDSDAQLLGYRTPDTATSLSSSPSTSLWFERGLLTVNNNRTRLIVVPEGKRSGIITLLVMLDEVIHVTPNATTVTVEPANRCVHACACRRIAVIRTLDRGPPASSSHARTMSDKNIHYVRPCMLCHHRGSP